MVRPPTALTLPSFTPSPFLRPPFDGETPYCPHPFLPSPLHPSGGPSLMVRGKPHGPGPAHFIHPPPRLPNASPSPATHPPPAPCPLAGASPCKVLHAGPSVESSAPCLPSPWQVFLFFKAEGCAGSARSLRPSSGSSRGRSSSFTSTGRTASWTMSGNSSGSDQRTSW